MDADSSGITGGVAPTCRKTDDNATLSDLEEIRMASRQQLLRSTSIWRLHDRAQHNSFPAAIPLVHGPLATPALVTEPLLSRSIKTT